MELTQVARPGIMLSQTWPKSRETEGATLKAFEESHAMGFFHSYQSVEVPFVPERKAIANLVKSIDCPYTYCAARIINENKLNLCTADPVIVRKTMDLMLRQIEHAREAGASALSFVSGPAPEDESDRQRALGYLRDSLVQLSEEARAEPGINLIIEPLDVVAHKKMTLGYTNEAVDLCKSVAASGGELFLCLDTAHMLLNHETPEEALLAAHPVTAEYHYSNCVTTPDHPKYGDYHMSFGPPGVVDVPDIARAMKAQLEMGYFNPDHRPVVMCEVLWQPGDDSVKLAHYCERMMREAWSLSQERN